jgi:glucosamine--fructose-6-phosphate aminotransferase (isomerizing)
VAVIHNGIIENFQSLRDRLSKTHTMVSDTDTECVAHLVEDAYQGNLGDAVRTAVSQLTGAYALVVTSTEEPDVIVGVKVSSPLVVGLGAGENMLASDIPALLSRTRTFVPISEGQVVEVREDSVRLTDLDGNEVRAEPMEVTWDLAAAEKSGYEDFMLKEIHEQPAAIRDTLLSRIDAAGRLNLDDLRIREEQIEVVDKVFVVACGTAFHAGLVAKYASEFRYRDPVLDSNTLTLAVSQSGETIDTLEAVRHARAQRSHVIAISNTVGSSIAREADGILYTHAGPERGVAATKTFVTQMAALYLVALYLAQIRGTLYPADTQAWIAQLRALPEQVERALALDEQVRGVAKRYASARDVLFIGRHTGYPAALEGALKLKEISYIHAEGYPAGELKHGPIALVEPGVPVVAVATECHVYPKVLSNIQEVKARGAEVIAVATEGDREIGKLVDHVLFVPRTHELLSPVVVTVPLQLLAYHIAKLRGCDVDQPRNLAKSVTVE